MPFCKDCSSTALVAAVLAVVVSFTGSAVLIFQAAHLAGLPETLAASWIWAVSIGSGVTGIFLSWKMKIPVITAWSTPGAALLIAMLPGVPLAEAIGAYIASAVIITVIGLTGTLDAIMRRIPAAVSSGMFAGILFSFGARVFLCTARPRAGSGYDSVFHPVSAYFAPLLCGGGYGCGHGHCWGQRHDAL